jgi:hypothetical protein
VYQDTSTNKGGPTTSVADLRGPVSPVLVAGLLLAAGEYHRALDLPCPTVVQVITSTGASRSRAYELRNAVLAVLPSLQQSVGRPPASPREVASDVTCVSLRAVATFLMDHPSCVGGGAERRRYTDAFRHFVLELREKHSDVEIEHFAEALMVPLGTLKEWLGAGLGNTARVGAPDIADDDTDAPVTTPPNAEIQVVLSSWETWRGTFRGFCNHLREEQRVSFGPSLISDILFVHGKRRPRRRAGRSPDEYALRRSFETFFGGAQWVGELRGDRALLVRGDRGMAQVAQPPLAACLNALVADERAVGALPAPQAAHPAPAPPTGSESMTRRAGCGKSARPDPWGAGTGTSLAYPTNHTSNVRAALGDVTILIRATTQRPQNKAHVEGGFGLFQQSVPALDLRGTTPRELAAQVLELVAQTWARTLNHRPRADRGGRSRIELYNEPITAEQIDAARAALEERRKKQELACRTASARQDPRVRALLDAAFQRLTLLDPEAHLRVAIARYPLDVIVDGLAIFEGKRRVGTLPPGVDARYLLGIVRNLGDEREGIAIAEELLRARLHARDHMLAPLVRARDAASAELPDVRGRVLRFVDLALAADRRIDRLFWLLAVADEINSHAKNTRAPGRRRRTPGPRDASRDLPRPPGRRAHHRRPRCPAELIRGVACQITAADLTPHTLSSERWPSGAAPRGGRHQAAPGDLTPHTSGGRPPFLADR